jgi:hypothetical protein
MSASAAIPYSGDEVGGRGEAGLWRPSVLMATPVAADP